MSVDGMEPTSMTSLVGAIDCALLTVEAFVGVSDDGVLLMANE